MCLHHAPKPHNNIVHYGVMHYGAMQCLDNITHSGSIFIIYYYYDIFVLLYEVKSTYDYASFGQCTMVQCINRMAMEQRLATAREIGTRHGIKLSHMTVSNLTECECGGVSSLTQSGLLAIYARRCESATTCQSYSTSRNRRARISPERFRPWHPKAQVSPHFEKYQ
jgi:hypothetical protein